MVTAKFWITKIIFFYASVMVNPPVWISSLVTVGQVKVQTWILLNKFGI